MKGHKRTKKLAVAVAATAILTLGMTSAYLADASENITNYFDPEWVKVDMQESGDQQYDIIPGTEEEKDPKVKVNNSVDAYVYLVVTDNVNAGREDKLVTYSLDSKWTEITKADLEGKTIYDSEGNEITLGDNDKLYYQIAPKTATGEGDEDKDDYEITYPVLVGDKVSYSTDITNEDLENLEKDGVQNILKFVAYAIQKDPFTDPVSALCHEAGEADDDTSLAEAKAAAKQEIADAAGENPTDAVQAIVEEYNQNDGTIDKQTTANDVNAKKQEAIDKINAQKEKEAAEKELADVKAAAKQAIADAAGDNPSPAVQAAVDEAEGAIDNATTPEEVEAAKAAGITAIEAAKAAELAAAKAALLEKINSYDPEGDNEHGNDAQNAAYADAIAAIDNATTPEEVEAAKAAGITAIENVATPSPFADINIQLKEQDESFEIAELAGYKNWNDAMAYAAEKGGRLATLDELKAIYNIEKDMSPRPIYSEMTGGSDAWAAGEVPGNPDRAYIVRFDNGYVFSPDKTYDRFVVVVRDLA